MKTNVIAHRGSKGTTPENTKASFLEALAVKSDGIELDVHLSKDNRLVVIHDETIDRTTNGKGAVVDYTLEELKQFDAGSWFAESFKEERILSLEDVLLLLSEREFKGILNIELKTNQNEYQGIEKIVLDLVGKIKPDFRIVYSSFNYRTLERLTQLNPDVEFALLFNEKNKNHKQLKNGITVLAWHTGLKTLLHILFQTRSIPIRVWTVNHSALLAFCFRKKVDSVITDFPEKALRIRRIVQGE